MRIQQADREAAEATVEAVRRKDKSAFDVVFAGAVSRYGGLERLAWAIAEMAPKS